MNDSTPKETGSLTRIEQQVCQVRDQASSLDSRTETVANQLFGIIPTTESAGEAVPTPESYTDRVAGVIREIERQLRDLEGSLSRIEQELN